jgi:phosphonate transport system substrate-binding protein
MWSNPDHVIPLGRPLLVAWCKALAFASARAGAAEYSLAVIPQFEQRRLYDAWKPIADELQRRTGHRVRLVTTAGVAEFETEFLKGTWDLVYMNPFFLGTTQRTLGYVPLVRDREEVSGILVVRKGTGPRSPRELVGKSVAFPTPYAVGACMLMRAELKQQFGVEVEPVFVRTVSNVALHVAKGLVVAGGMPEKAWSLLEPPVRERLEVIHRTRAIRPHAIAAHPRIPPADREAMRSALVALAATEAGKAVFAKVPMTAPIATSAEEYAVIAKLGLEAWYVPPAREPEAE